MLQRSIVVTFVACAVAVTAGAVARAQSSPGPCDLLANAGTPCVAAHAMTRALYAGYAGPLYQVRRMSDASTLDVGVERPGGYAGVGPEDAFCAGTVCLVTRIYDQSPQHNDLTIEGAGGAGVADHGAHARLAPIVVGGRKAYGLFIEPRTGYRDDATRGVAVGAEPESMYMVASGTHVNARCCFDYGNAERNNRDTGNGHMDAVNLSTICPPPRMCDGAGPWVQADLENGLFMSARGGDRGSGYTGSPYPFVTALLKNDGRTFFALKTGNAQSGPLTPIYRGHEPLWKPGYSPMHLEGAIVLGTGGDNSNGSIGTFYEGVMTQGVTSPATDDAVQANVVAAGYAPAP